MSDIEFVGTNYDATPLPVEITRGGTVIATVIVRVPLRLELAEALVLAEKLFGDETLPVTLEAERRRLWTPEAPSARDPEELAREQVEAQHENLRSRAEALDLPALQAWLRALDPANPHMSVAHDVVSERIAELEAGAVGASETSPVVQALVDEARELEASYREQVVLAEAGDDQARLRATEIRSRLVQLQEDIRDGVDRQTEEAT